MEDPSICQKKNCGAKMKGLATISGHSRLAPETDAYLEAEIERLRALVSWIETYDPQLVNAAEAKFPAPPSDGARPASRQ